MVRSMVAFDGCGEHTLYDTPLINGVWDFFFGWLGRIRLTRNNTQFSTLLKYLRDRR
jgi:hypothetical protein